MINELLAASRQLRRAVEEDRSVIWRRDYRAGWPSLWQAIDAVLASDPEPFMSGQAAPKVSLGTGDDQGP